MSHPPSNPISITNNTLFSVIMQHRLPCGTPGASAGLPRAPPAVRSICVQHASNRLTSEIGEGPHSFAKDRELRITLSHHVDIAVR